MHKKTGVACVMISPPNGGVEKHTATFGTLALAKHTRPLHRWTNRVLAFEDAKRKRSGSQPKIPIPGTRTLPQKVAETKQKTLDGPMNGYTFLAGL